MNLVSVYQHPEATKVLYALLKEREGATNINISHRKTPPWREHLKFVRKHPYAAWYLILVGADEAAGAVYVTKAGEIGIHIFKAYQGRGLGPEAVKEVMRLTPRRQYLANVNPANEKSAAMFKALGFKPLQMTYELKP